MTTNMMKPDAGGRRVPDKARSLQGWARINAITLDKGSFAGAAAGRDCMAGGA